MENNMEKEIENKNENEILLYSTDPDDYSLSREEYRECCELEDDEEIEDSSYYGWVDACMESYTDDFFAGCNNKFDNCEVMIEGTLGLWNGNHAIWPVYVEGDERESSVTKAILKCGNVSGDTTMNVRLVKDQGVIRCEVSHHDGTNVLYIKKLTKEGERMARYIEMYGEDDENRYANLTYEKFTEEDFNF